MRTVYGLLGADGRLQSSDAPDTALVTRMAQLAAADPADEPVAMTLGWLYWLRYGIHGARADLDNAVRQLSPFFLPDRVHLIPKGLRAEIADAYGTHIGSQLTETLASGGDLGRKLSGLTHQCRFLLAHADPESERYAGHLNALAALLIERHQALGDVRDLLEAVDLSDRAARTTPVDHPDGPAYHASLAFVLVRLHHVTRSPDNLRRACEASEAALRLPLSADVREGLVDALGRLLTERIDHAMAESDWGEVVAAARSAVDHPKLGVYGEDRLATALLRRYRATGTHAEDLDEVIRLRTSLVRELTRSGTDVQRRYMLHQLGLGHWHRYQHAGRPDDLDAAIDLNERALSCGPDNGARLAIKRDLVIALLVRLENRPPPEGRPDVERLITVSRAELSGPTEHRPRGTRDIFAYALPLALRYRFEYAHDSADLDEAAECLRSAAVTFNSLDKTLPHETNAAVVHHLRYRAGRGLGSLREAVAVSRRLVEAVPHTHPARPTVLALLSTLLTTLSKHTGELAERDEAVTHAREAVGAVGADALDGPDGTEPLYALGMALSARGAHPGSLDDLNAAVDAHRRALASNTQEWGQGLYGLGVALSAQAERTGDAGALDEAIELLRQAVDRWGNEAAAAQSALSYALMRRHLRDDDATDLDEALAAGQRAADATSEGDPESLHGLASLATALLTERRRNPERVDVEELFALCRRIVDRAPDDHADLGRFRNSLGFAGWERAKALDSSHEALTLAAEVGITSVISYDTLMAAREFVSAAESRTAPPSLRIQSAWSAAELIAPMDTAWAQDLLEYAVSMIPLVAPRRIGRLDQQHALRDVSELVSLTVANALAAGLDPHPRFPRQPLLPDSAQRTLRVLEQGRAVLTSQLLETRGDVSELRRRHPDLAERFVRLRDLLDGEADLDTGPGSLDRPRAATELTAVIKEIRSRTGFASFARPPDPGSLLGEADEGPIVVFNCFPVRCDALLVQRDSVRHLPLPGLTHDGVTRQTDRLQRTLAVIADPDSDWRAQRAAQRTLDEILKWLWDVAAEPVLLALGIDSRPAGEDEPPRVWWSPGGLLGALPLHAAGHHAEAVGAGSGRTVMDRVISSYTPTIGALRHARRERAADNGPDRSLVVAMPFTPGAPPLFGAAEEAAAVAARLPNATVLTGPDRDTRAADDGRAPTKAGVLAVLSDVSVAHLACHALTDPAEPSRSRLLLWDQETAPLTVAGVASVPLDRAELAYLSACRTTSATTARGLVDEGIHLTSAFQLAGFRHVVGTLWEVDDMVSVRIASAFYAALERDDGMEYAHAAAALRTSLLSVRDDFPKTPSLWAGHLHAGA
ncbi:CHAT domain-containing protein [Streptomyces sp. SID6648]|nr:CHAT domain-containing protein [Streptomyces sp. SID6648]